MNMKVPVTALVLAAGSSSRFGSDKRLACLPGGQRVLDQTIQHCGEAGLDLLVVLGPDDELLVEQLDDQGVKTVIAASASGGMGYSLAAGAAAVDEKTGIVVVLGDMPYVKPFTLRGVAERLAAGNGIVRPVYKGQPGHPVGFSAAYHRQLRALSGDSGAQHLLHRHSGELLSWNVSDPGVIRDIDYPADVTGS